MREITAVRFLDALHGRCDGRPPVWLMRQAGRYMPSYRALREKYPLKTLFFTPELAADITLMPIEQLGVDAAILFSDLTVVAPCLGLDLDFADGPKVNPYISPDNLSLLKKDEEKIDPMIETIGLLLPRLQVPLIGFCGAPFTVATYFVEGGIDGAKKWAYRSPESFSHLLDRILSVTITYMKRQEEAGVAALQIFDSWANVLSKEHFELFCLPFYKKMIAAVSVPVILFMRGAWAHIDTLAKLPCALSLDWQNPLKEARKRTKQTLQGNLDPDLLYAPFSTIRNQAKGLLQSMEGDRAFIANLGHGLKPDMPYEAVKVLIETLQGG